jgi:hypothetical protein
MRGSCAIVSPVDGFSTGNVSPESASAHVPSMYALVRKRSVSSMVTRETISVTGIHTADTPSEALRSDSEKIVRLPR